MRVAVAQLELAPGALAANRDTTAAAIREARADLVVLPELASSGYGLTTKEDVDRAAEPIPGPATEAWLQAAGEAGSIVVGGICERAGDAVYNSVAVVDSGGVIGRYRKLHLFDNEQELYTPGDEGLPVFDTPLGRIGTLVCYDLRFVEAMRILAVQGADVVAVPTAWIYGFNRPEPPADGIIDHARNAALQANLNAVYVLVASTVGDDGGPLNYLGSSCVVDPYGQFVLEPRDDEHESVSVVEIDAEEARRAKVRGPRIRPLDNRRTDVYDEWLGYSRTIR